MATRPAGADERQDGLYRAALGASLDAVVVMDADGRITDFTGAAEEVFGRSARSAIGRTVAELLIPERLRGAHWAGLRRLSLGGASRILGRRVELTALRADGSEVAVELTVQPVDGAFVAYIREIEERRRAASELERTRAALDLVLRGSGTGAWEWDLQTGTMAWSPAVFTMHGLDAHELPASIDDIWEYVHPEDRSMLRERLARVVAGVREASADYRILRPDGGLLPVHVTARALTDAEGRPVRILGTVRDASAAQVDRRALLAHRAVEAAIRDWGAFEPSMEDLLRRLASVMGWSVAACWTPAGTGADLRLRLRLAWVGEGAEAGAFLEDSRSRALRPGEGLPGRAWRARGPLSAPSLEDDPHFTRGPSAAAVGLRSGLAFPAAHGDEILAVLEFFAADPRELSDEVAETLRHLGTFIGWHLARRRADLGPQILSPREREILALGADGLDAKAIAAALHVSPATIRTHFQNVYEKLGVNDRSSAVAQALRVGLID